MPAVETAPTIAKSPCGDRGVKDVGGDDISAYFVIGEGLLTEPRFASVVQAKEEVRRLQKHSDDVIIAFAIGERL